MTDPLAVVEPLRRRLGTWTARSWAHRTASGATRAELTAASVQRLADLAADAEGRPHRVVPALPGPAGAGLADQLAVMVHDLVRAGDERSRATAERELGDLATALGLTPPST